MKTEKLTQISVKNLKLSFSNNLVIDDASFDIEAGDFVCIVGANGSGKSTIVKTILKLIKPQSGQVQLKISPKDIGYLPQESQSHEIFPAIVSEVILSGTLGNLGLRICYQETEKQKMLAILKKLGILKLKDKSFAELSGGQKQKVLLARALVSDPKILILDEPSNHLDLKSKKDFYNLLKTLNTEVRMTILIITHDLDAEDLIGNKIIAIEDTQVKIYPTSTYLRRFK